MHADQSMPAKISCGFGRISFSCKLLCGLPRDNMRSGLRNRGPRTDSPSDKFPLKLLTPPVFLIIGSRLAVPLLLLLLLLLLVLFLLLFAPCPFILLNVAARAASRSDIGGKAKLENVDAVASPTIEVKCSAAAAIPARVVLFSLNSDGIVVVVGGVIGGGGG